MHWQWEKIDKYKIPNEKDKIELIINDKNSVRITQNIVSL